MPNRLAANTNQFLACSYAALCSGCDWLLVPLKEQRQRKTDFLKSALNLHFDNSELPEIKFLSINKGGLRDRVDLSLERKGGIRKVGLFDRFRSGIVDLQGCPQLSSDLEDWLKDFRKVRFLVEKGSVRLRVSPKGNRGVWLDLANVDIKQLLEERTLLEQLGRLAIVEIGQKRKSLIERDGQLKLGDPVLRPWFETYFESEDGDEDTVPLYCTIGSFTQPGFVANRALVGEVRRQLKDLGSKVVAEFGSGIGNFTLPLASIAETVHAYEVDELALEGLKLSLEKSGLKDRVKISAGNFQVDRKVPVEFKGVDLVFVDPPRSGVMKFLDPIEHLPADERPKQFLYVSCFAESFAHDCARLKMMGYKFKELTIVDQFPQSRHFEIVASLTR